MVSDVKYEEQHVTKFTKFNIVKKVTSIYLSLLNKYKVELIKISQFPTPYIALINYSAAKKLSASYNVCIWKNPFGSIIMLKLVKI